MLRDEQIIGQVVEAETEFTDEDVVAVAHITFVENAEINEGMCSCVCINDEQCCGCLLQ